MTDIEPLITSSELESAVVGEEPNTSEPVVTIHLTDIGARLFDDHAADHLGEQIAVVLDGVVLTAPVLYASEFGGQMLIVGDFTESEARSLAAILRSGSLPYPINVQVEQ
jgi:preprotein translocase subunit SecD